MAVMDVGGFLLVSLGSSTVQLHDSLCSRRAAQSSFMTVYVADAHAHVQRLVSIVKMATVLQEYSTEERRFVMRFYLWTTELNAYMSIKNISCLQCEVFVA
jgi:hypothetical protein